MQFASRHSVEMATHPAGQGYPLFKIYTSVHRIGPQAFDLKMGNQTHQHKRAQCEQDKSAHTDTGCSLMLNCLKKNKTLGSQEWGRLWINLC